MTSFDTVIDRALSAIQDYKLAKLYQKSAADFQTYCDGHLIAAIPKFYQAKDNLSYNATTRTFDRDLTDIEVSILANLWVLEWWEQQKNNAAQIELKLKTPSSFSYNSEAQNMKEKQVVIDKLREENNRLITGYQLIGYAGW